MKPELGDEVRCKVTQLQGVAIAISMHLTGCDRLFIQPPIDKDGKGRDGFWVDLVCTDVVEKGKVKPNDVQETGPAAKPGGPMSRVR